MFNIECSFLLVVTSFDHLFCELFLYSFAKYMVHVHFMYKYIFKIVQIITTFDEVFNHVLNMN
jgi:hypothetical protein